MVGTRALNIIVLNNKFGSCLKFYPFHLTLDPAVGLKVSLKSKFQQFLSKLIGICLIFGGMPVLIFGLTPIALRISTITLKEQIIWLAIFGISIIILAQSVASIISLKSILYVVKLFFNSDSQYGKQC